MVTRSETNAPETPRFPTTQERRNKLDAIIWGSIAVSVILHFFVFVALPTFDSADVATSTGELAVLEIPPEIEIPPPPDAIQRPAVPVVAAADMDISPDITISPTTFDANPVEDLPPPPEESSDAAEIYETPTFTPYTVAPGLANREEAARAVMRAWPSVYRDAGVGGVVQVWVFIDETGTVVNAKVSETSGVDELDAAALEAASEFRFSPAMNRDQKVKVWVQLPITFTSQTRLAG